MKKVFMIVMLAMFGISFIGISSVTAGDCGPYGTGTPGYWKNHPGEWENVEIEIGTETYTQARALPIMDGPVKGDKWITMFKAYVAAYLNVEIGNCRPCCDYEGRTCDSNLDSALGWLVYNQGLRPVKARDDEWQYSHGEAKYWCLDDYNNGLLDMPSRDALE